MTASDGIRPSFAGDDAPAPDLDPPVGSDQRVSDPEDETTRADATIPAERTDDVTIDEEAADPLDDRPVGDPDS